MCISVQDLQRGTDFPENKGNFPLWYCSVGPPSFMWIGMCMLEVGSPSTQFCWSWDLFCPDHPLLGNLVHPFLVWLVFLLSRVRQYASWNYSYNEVKWAVFHFLCNMKSEEIFFANPFNNGQNIPNVQTLILLIAFLSGRLCIMCEHCFVSIRKRENNQSHLTFVKVRN